MIAETGIYVFESKNYSGWIFGDEKGKNWTQVLENKQKNHFYNPVWQNNGHITALKYATGFHNPELYKSHIVFSERCTLKKVNVNLPNVFVMKSDLQGQTPLFTFRQRSSSFNQKKSAVNGSPSSDKTVFVPQMF